MRLAIYAGKFYMLGDVILNGYNGEIYGHTESGKSQSSYTMRKVVVENNKVVSATGKITIFNVIATLGNGDNNNDNQNSSANTNIPKIIKKDSNTNIKIEAESGIVPDDTIIDVIEIASGETFEKIKGTLAELKKFKSYDITLKSNGTNIQPNGKVKISIPIPVDFDTSKLVVYRFEENGTKIEYQVKVENGYATFETDHFSTYVLGEAEETITLNNDTELPKTGEKTNTFAKWLSIAIALGVFWIFCMLLIERENKKMIKKQ